MYYINLRPSSADCMSIPTHPRLAPLLSTPIPDIFDDTDNIFFAAILKTVNMFCRRSYLIVLIYNINLGNVHIIRSWYLK